MILLIEGAAVLLAVWAMTTYVAYNEMAHHSAEEPALTTAMRRGGLVITAVLALAGLTLIAMDFVRRVVEVLEA